MSLEGGDSFKLSKQERKRVLLQLLGSSAQCLDMHGQNVVSPGRQEVPRPVTEILRCYEDIFKEPKGLPPIRAHDHSIPL